MCKGVNTRTSYIIMNRVTPPTGGAGNRTTAKVKQQSLGDTPRRPDWRKEGLIKFDRRGSPGDGNVGQEVRIGHPLDRPLAGGMRKQVAGLETTEAAFSTAEVWKARRPAAGGTEIYNTVFWHCRVVIHWCGTLRDVPSGSKLNRLPLLHVRTAGQSPYFPCNNRGYKLLLLPGWGMKSCYSYK